MIKSQNTRRILDYFTAIKYICKPFRTFLQTKMTDFPTRSAGGEGGGRVESYFLYIRFNEINPNDVLTTCKAHYSKTKDQRFWRRNKIVAIKGGTVSHHYILVIRKFIDFMSLFRHSVWFALSFKQFSFAEFRMCNIWLIRTTEELSYRVVFSFKPKET